MTSIFSNLYYSINSLSYTSKYGKNVNLKVDLKKTMNRLTMYKYL